MLRRGFGRIALLANDIYNLMFEAIFAAKGIGILKQIPVADMDIMISTYGDVGNLLLALKVKKMKKGIKWISDYRDPVLGESGIKRKYIKHIALRADKKADYITGVAKSCITAKQYLNKFEVIPNGFDRDDIKGFSIDRRSRQLQIVYTGSLYGGRRDMSLLFKIISELESEGAVDRNYIAVLYAGSHFHVLQEQAKAYHLEDIVFNKGRISRDKALYLQFQSDILCALTWNSENEEDVITGKFIEYFMMKKNIFSIVTGNKTNSIVKRITDKGKLGHCLEVIGGNEAYREAKEWFLEKYIEFIENGHIKSHMNESIVEKFSSAKMAEKFGRIIEKC